MRHERPQRPDLVPGFDLGRVFDLTLADVPRYDLDALDVRRQLVRRLLQQNQGTVRDHAPQAAEADARQLQHDAVAIDMRPRRPPAHLFRHERQNVYICQQARALRARCLLAVAGSDGSLGRVQIDEVFPNELLLFAFQRGLGRRRRSGAARPAQVAVPAPDQPVVSPRGCGALIPRYSHH